MRIRNTCLAIAFILGGFLASIVSNHVVERVVAALPLPGVQGPSLGDQNINLYTLTQSYVSGTNVNFSPTVTAGAAATQSTCALITNLMSDVTVSAANGSICLPPALAGRVVLIGNASGQTVNIYGSNTPFLAGTQDTINGTAGSTAYTSMTSAKNADCFAPANGAWFCGSTN